MASNSESGHAVNISNYKLLIDNCTSFGTAYNPSNTLLTITNMTAQWTTADEAHQTLISAVQNAKQPINERELLFEPLDQRVTRVVGMLNSTEASKNAKQDAKGYADKIRGVIKKPKQTEAALQSLWRKTKQAMAWRRYFASCHRSHHQTAYRELRAGH